MTSKRTILLTDGGQISEEAEKLLTENNIPYEILPREAIWEEIEFPIPTLFHMGRKAYKGLEEIRDALHELNPPN
jgi:hypothetical protein